MPGIGLDLDHYRRTPELLARSTETRAELGLSEGAELLSVVAELIPRKNHVAALHALARTPDADLHLALAGMGPLERALREEVARLGIGHRVSFLGTVQDVRPLLLASSAMVLPSKQEGLSRAVMESLALGVPVLGGRSRGITELLQHGGGVLVDRDDVSSLTQAFLRLADLPRGEELTSQVAGLLSSLALPSLLTRHERMYAAVLAQQVR